MPLATFNRSKVDMFFWKSNPFEKPIGAARFAIWLSVERMVLCSCTACWNFPRFLAQLFEDFPNGRHHLFGVQRRRSRGAASQTRRGSPKWEHRTRWTPLLFPADHSENHHAHNWPFDSGQQDARSAEGQLMLSAPVRGFTYVQSPEIFAPTNQEPA